MKKESFHVLFNFKSDRWPEAQQVFIAAGRPDLATADKQTFGYSLDFDSQQELEIFEQQAAKFGFTDSYTVRRERSDSAEDLRHVPLLWLRVTVNPNGNGGPTYGTEYDLSSACPVCGTGARQTSPLIVEAEDLPEKAKVAATLDGEVLFHESLAGDLIDRGFAEDAFGLVLARETNKALPWRQLRALGELPAMSRKTKGIIREGGCSKCRRDGYFHDNENPIEIRYDISQQALGDLPPVLATWECFGQSTLRSPFEKSHFAQPLFMIKPKMYELLQGQKIRGLDYTPIELTKST
jgi:hypothetical protein